MTLRMLLKKPSVQIRVGLVFLILASLAKWFLEPASGLPDSWTDAVTGLLYGISIGFMLLGISRRGRSQSA